MTIPKRQLSINVEGSVIEVTKVNDEDYISLTAMVHKFGGNTQIQNWLRQKDNIEFLGAWESLYNRNFNSIEFDRIRNLAGTNRFILSVKEWVGSTGAVGIVAKTGRYGGTYAHRDIAFEFATWLSPVFKLLVITEFQRLKEKEQQLEHWDFRRFLSKANYRLHTDTIKSSMLPALNLPKLRERFVYTDEADMLNLIVFGQTAKEWREANDIKSNLNQRDYASAKELLILANIESINSHLISKGISRDDRLKVLYDEARRQNEMISDEALNIRALDQPEIDPEGDNGA